MRIGMVGSERMGFSVVSLPESRRRPKVSREEELSDEDDEEEEVGL